MKTGLLAMGCGLLVGAVPATAQQLQRLPRTHAVELTFSAGLFQPTGAPGAAAGLVLRRKPTWEAGVHFGAYAKSGWWGAEVSAGYAPERVSQGGMGSRRTHLVYGTARALVGRSPRKRGVAVMAGAGIGLLHRQNSVTDFAVATSHAGGAASLLIRLPIDDEVALRLDAQDLIYRADFGTGKKLRNDFVLSAGLGISW